MITRAGERPVHLPLSFAQRRLWFVAQFEAAAAAYNVSLILRLTGALDRPALQAALGDVVARHESLRTLFPAVDGEPFQRVLPRRAAAPLVTWAQVGADELAQQAEQACEHVFDLEQELPVRARVLSARPGEHVLVLLMHHIACDGWSIGPLSRDLARAYAARAAGTPPAWDELPVQYADYTLWQYDRLGDKDDPGSVMARQSDFWREALKDLPEELALPCDRPRPAAASYRGGLADFAVGAGLHARLLALGRGAGVTTFMVMQAGLALLLTRLGAGTDIPLGVPVSGHADAALAGLVGFFVNTLVLRTDTSRDPSFAELLARVRKTDLAAFQHRDLPFEQLVEVIAPARSLARHPLFQVMLSFQSDVAAAPDMPGLRVEEVPRNWHTAKFDLTFMVREQHADGGGPAGLGGVLEFATDLFDAGTAALIAQRYVRVLAAVAADPALRLSQVQVIDEAERDQLLRAWNGTAAPLPASAVRVLEELGVAAAGSPVPNARVFVLDDRLAPAPTGVAGELYLAGAGPARDDLDRPGPAGERLVACPFGGRGQRMFRTGGLARWTAGGELELLGRAGDRARGCGAEPAPAEGRRRHAGHEQVLRGMFADVLGIGEVGVDDDFFRLGGHSLLAFRLLARIRARFGVPLSLPAFMQEPTVLAVSAALAGGADTGAPEVDVLVALREDGPRPPLFCVHPVTGLSRCYGTLARCLTGRPVYGLQAPGIGRPGAPVTGPARLADEYIAQIRRAQPAGPYHLLGWSLGGNIAHAIACALQDQGDEVGLLALMDSYPLTGGGPPAAISPATMAELIGRETGTAADLDMPFIELLARAATGLRQRVGAAPIGRFKGPALFFTATLERTGRSPTAQAWAPFISGAIENHAIEIGHFDMAQTAPLTEIALIVAGALDRAPVG